MGGKGAGRGVMGACPCRARRAGACAGTWERNKKQRGRMAMIGPGLVKGDGKGRRLLTSWPRLHLLEPPTYRKTFVPMVYLNNRTL